MTDDSITTPNGGSNTEDYTGSLCWLLPKGEHTIVDVETIPLMEAHKWRIAWVTSGTFKRVVRNAPGGGLQYLHREISGNPVGNSVDHKNRCTVDNRRCNLRTCTHSQNMMNSGGSTRGTSRFKGVYFHAGTCKWMARISVAGSLEYLGLFREEADAARAYNARASEAFGEFAYLNPV